MTNRLVRMWIAAGLLVLLWSNLQPAGAQTAGDAPVTAGIQLLIALDDSGSMSRTVAGDYNNILSVDRGPAELFYDNLVTEVGPTDPDDLRYQMTESVLTWLSAYAANQENVAIYARVEGFTTSTTTHLEWTQLNNTTFRSGFDLNPTETGSGQHSDFLNLYRTVGDAFDAAPGGSNARQVLLVVTDSAPCNPSAEPDIVNGTRVRDEFCDRSFGGHIQALPSLDQTGEYVFYVNPVPSVLSLAEQWAAFDGLLEAWENRLPTSLYDVSQIENVPRPFVEAVMRELALARGILDSQDTTGTTGLTADVYQALGMQFTNAGVLDVLPYQSSLNMLALPTRQTAEIDVRHEDDDSLSVQNVTAPEALVRVLRLELPPAGEVTVQTNEASTLPVWAVAVSARARLQLQPETPQLYQAQRLSYQLLSEDDTLLSIQPDTRPLLSAQLTSPDGEAFTLDGWEIQQREGQTGLLSPSFFPVEAGAYAVDLDVTTPTTALWGDVSDANFLIPDVPGLTVRPVTFDVDYEIEGEVDSSDLIFPRSRALTVRLTMRADDDTVMLPDGLTADVAFLSVAGESSACPPAETQQLQRTDNDLAATTTIFFDQAGVCELAVRLELTTSLPPAGNDTSLRPEVDNERQVTILPTERLELVLLDGNDTVLTAGDSLSRYMQEPLPLWDAKTMELWAEFRNQGGERVWPAYQDGATRVDADFCLPVSDNVPEATVEPGETPADTSAVLQTNRLVPVRLRITNEAGNDIAREQRICFYATDEVGRYRAQFTVLPAGSYTIAVELSRDNPPLDMDNFEYSRTLFDGVRDDSYRLEIPLTTAIHPLFITQMVVIAVFVLAVTGRIAFALSQQRRRTMHPLSGTVAIYYVPDEIYQQYQSAGDAEEVEALQTLIRPLWLESLPQENTVVFSDVDFVGERELMLLGITELTVSTHREPDVSEAGDFYVHLRTSEDLIALRDERIDDGVIRFMAAYRGGRYYLANTPPDNLTVHALLKQTLS